MSSLKVFSDDSMWDIHNDLIHICEEIGRGNYSIVCKVNWRANDKNIENAIKLLYGTRKEFKEGYLDSYVREIFCSSLLKYRTGIVEMKKKQVDEDTKTYDYGIFMKRAKFTLKNILAYSEYKRPPIHAARIITKKCLETLAYYHSKDMIHHDVKPENFLIYLNDDSPDNFEIELIDFSLSTFMKTSQNQNVVTLWWRPLELLLKSCAHSNTVDVWSIGVVILELLTGRNLFRGTKSPARIAEIIFYYWGYPCKNDWKELHDNFKLNEEGRIPPNNLLYGLYCEEFEFYKLFIPLLEECFKLKGNERISCNDLLQKDFFSMVPFEKDIKEANAWFVAAFNFASQERLKSYPINLTDPLPKSYGIYSWEKSMELLTPLKCSEKPKSLKRNRDHCENSKLIEANLERIKSSKTFILSLCQSYNVQKSEINEITPQSTRLLLASMLYNCSNINEVHMGCIIVVCAYMCFVLTMDESPSLFEMVELINTERDPFYKDCTRIFPIILKELKCEIPNLNKVEFQAFIKNESWILG